MGSTEKLRTSQTEVQLFVTGNHQRWCFLISNPQQSSWREKVRSSSAVSATKPSPKTSTFSSTSEGEFTCRRRRLEAISACCRGKSPSACIFQPHGGETVPVHRLRPSLRPEVQREEAHADSQGLCPVSTKTSSNDFESAAFLIQAAVAGNKTNKKPVSDVLSFKNKLQMDLTYFQFQYESSHLIDASAVSDMHHHYNRRLARSYNRKNELPTHKNHFDYIKL